jgi:hypothetical protein
VKITRATTPDSKPKKPKKLTHTQLVRLASNWLKNTQRCHLVASEVVTSISECPDAIGWYTHGWSILVECKTSRADFQADQKKYFRHHSTGLGQERYYLTQPGLLRPHELPEDWGLLEAHTYSSGSRGHYVRVIHKAGRNRNEHSIDSRILTHEARMIISLASRTLRAFELVGKLGVGADVEEESS